MSKTKEREATDALVIFGITGDLARKMTFRALYRLEKRGKLDCPIIGVGRNQDWHHETMKQRAEEAIRGSVDEFDLATFRRLADRMRFVNGNFDEEDLYQSLGGELADYERPLFYLEIPPPLFSEVVHGLANAGLVENARVILEKPFGHDFDSAQELQADLLTVLEEDQILRIDHYLGKEPVMDITYLRFANALL
ncbi:MAG TPA: glucose-6-phosphate dehydrogenase, partial [Solirubrobacterales bacterium]|nr:glucose-6-phosphate dehydrogenase [Solirubrobacterales bacterium]